MAKLFFFDVETTGLSTYKCAMHQIAGAIVINGVIKETFDIKLAPFEGAVIEDKALEVSHVTESQIKAYPPPINAYRQILKMLGKYVDKYDKKDKFFLVGYNNKGFDNDFMRNFFKQQGDNYFGSWFWAGAIDVMVLAADYLQEEIPNMVDFKLRTVAEYLGIKLDPAKLHDALYDIEITKMVYDIVHHDSKKKRPVANTKRCGAKGYRNLTGIRKPAVKRARSGLSPARGVHKKHTKQRNTVK